MEKDTGSEFTQKSPGREYILLKNGLIVDGSGKTGNAGSVLIKGNKIEQISEGPIDIDCETMDCSDLVISPGFIDAHSHMDWVLAMEGYENLKNPYTAQGCTTFVTGNCGFSPGGFRTGSEHLGMIKLGAGGGFDISWTAMDGYFKRLENVGLSHNIVHLTGHGTTQISMRGLNTSPLDKGEMDELLGLLEEAMDQGACGVSFGLGYEPGMFFTKNNIREVARLVKQKDKIVTVHGRVYSFVSAFYPRESKTPHNVLSLQEMIDVAKDTGVRMQYSHLMFAGTSTHPTYKECLEVLGEAISDGVDVMIDTYPYHCGNSVINVVLPPWFLANIPANYHDNKMLNRVERGLDNMSRSVGFGYDDIQLVFANHPDFDPYNGMFIDEIANKLNISPARAVVELSEKTNGRARILNHNYSDMEVIDALIAHPACLFMTDAVAASEGVQNPAAYGAFPLLLQYSRDRHLLSLEEAVHKMTGATAERFYLKDRGFLKERLAADITVFDWKNIKDNNTIKETDQAPTGIEAVFINGRQVKKNGLVDGSVTAGVVNRI